MGAAMNPSIRASPMGGATRRERFMQRFVGLRPWKRHSLVLAVLGVVYVLLGASLFTPLTDDQDFLGFRLMDPAGWGVIWVAVGALAILSSRWPPASETWGYTALSSLSSLWGALSLATVALGGDPEAVRGGVMWLGIAFLWWAISGLKNPNDVPKVG